MIKCILSGLLLLTLVSCAAGPKLADYPRREIDRPFTLPKGIATWSTIGYESFEHYRGFFDGEVYTDRSGVPILPLVWRQSLSDDWNLLWAPIPVAAFYQLRSDAAATTGLIFGYGLKLSDYGYSAGAVSAAYSHRQKLSSDFAVDFMPTVTPWFPLGHKAKWDLQSSVAAGPFWQVADLFSVSTGARLVLRKYSTTVISGNFFEANSLDIYTRDDWKLSLPVYARLNWSFARQWDFEASVEYQKIGEVEPYSNLLVGYELRHYW